MSNVYIGVRIIVVLGNNFVHTALKIVLLSNGFTYYFQGGPTNSDCACGLLYAEITLSLDDASSFTWDPTPVCERCAGVFDKLEKFMENINGHPIVYDPINGPNSNSIVYAAIKALGGRLEKDFRKYHFPGVDLSRVKVTGWDGAVTGYINPKGDCPPFPVSLVTFFCFP